MKFSLLPQLPGTTGRVFALLSAILVPCIASAAVHKVFNAPSTISIHSGLVFTADINGDGNSDLLYLIGGSVQPVLGDGQGGFSDSTAISVTTTATLSYGVVGDFNGDGKTDIAVGSSSNVWVLLSQGNGTFTIKPALSVLNGTQIATGDVDGDGKLDLMLITNASRVLSSSVQIFPGNGDGTFRISGASAVLPPSTSYYSLSVADVNGDHRADLIAGMEGALPQAGIAVLLANSSGGFQTPVYYSTGVGGTTGSVALTTGDFNRDGKPDIAVSAADLSGANPSVFSILLGNGNGTFTAPSRLTSSGYAMTGSPASSILAADVNGDGLLDVVFSGQWQGSPQTQLLLTFTGNGDGSFAVGLLSSLPEGKILLTDVDHDGFPDIIISASNNTILSLNQQGNFQQIPPPAQRSGQALTLSGAIQVADLNLDGAQDVVLTSNDAAFETLLGNNDGTVLAPVQSPVTRAVGASATADLDGDGKIDLVIAPPTGPIQIWWGNGDGSFSSSTLLPALFGGVDQLAIRDMNGDGYWDIVLENPLGIYVLIGNGDGTFRFPVFSRLTLPVNLAGIVPTGNAMAIGDFNRDGKLDIAIVGVTIDRTETTTGAINILLGQGDGSFVQGSVYTVANCPNAVAVGDMNADGIPDLVVANVPAFQSGYNVTASQSSVTVYLGQGNGSFQLAQTLTGVNFPAALALADIDNDGYWDIITANFDTSDISIFLGASGTTFSKPQRYYTGNSLFGYDPLSGNTSQVALAIGDFNSDGWLDIATIAEANGGYGYQTPSLEIFLNARGTPASLNNTGFESGASNNWAQEYQSSKWATIAVDSQAHTGSYALRIAATPGASIAAGVSSYVAARNNFATPCQSGDNYSIGYWINAQHGTFATGVVITSGLLLDLQFTDGSSQRYLPTSSVDTTSGYQQVQGVFQIPTVAGKTVQSFTVAFYVQVNNSSSSAVVFDTSHKLIVHFDDLAIAKQTQAQLSVSMTPGSGSGLTQALVFRFSDSQGWQNLDVVDILINSSLDGRQACFIAYSRSANTVYLVTDTGGLLPGLVLNGSGTTSNNQCSISGQGSSVSGSGTTMVLTLNVTFKSAFAGNRVFYMSAQDIFGASSGWVPAGVWQIPGSPATGTISLSQVNPGSGSGRTQTFIFTFSDTKGYQDIGVINVLLNGFLDGATACSLAYARTTNTLYLFDDAGVNLLPGLVLAGQGSLSNSQCSISGAGSSGSGSGTTFTLRLNMTFSSSFAGNSIFYVAGRDVKEGNNTGWQTAGVWQVP